MDEAIAARDGAIHEMGERFADVEAKIAEGIELIESQAVQLVGRQARIDELERIADRLAERLVGRERELERAREEIERLRSEAEHRVEALARIAEDLEGVRAQARGQATRIRLKALRDAAELTDRISELAKRPAGMRERLITAIEEALERLGAGDEEAGAFPAEENGSADREPGELFQGLVQVEIGPLSDFSQLVRFEDAAGAIGATSEISVRRFTRGRATLDLKLAQPVELLRELEERAPFEFRIRDTRSDRVILDVDDEER